ncbi:MAG: hypothetical protein BWK77_05675 [Verrucomicrobia bacterium A1]|nr:MAG: hypothetical protein BWK77_05675 [Verrucomicrobia bacterium A1]
MKPRKPAPSVAERDRILAELHRDAAARQQSYRERALRVLPHICASCAREFSGQRLRELTVHHKDHNHDNNPPDGSNWELLCMYCHDHEHEKHKMAGYGGGAESGDEPKSPSIANPFDGLDKLLNPPDAKE